MQKQKLRQVGILVKDIKAKIDHIAEINAQVNIFNFKLEALLCSLDEVSVATTRSEDQTAEILNIPLSSLAVHKTVMDPVAKKERPKKEKKQKEEKPAVERILDRIYSIVPENVLYRSNAEKLVRFLFSSKEGVFYDDILKKSGVSKYRCIDILNLLMNAEPPLVNKSFDKGFIYKLNLDWDN